MSLLKVIMSLMEHMVLMLQFTFCIADSEDSESVQIKVFLRMSVA